MPRNTTRYYIRGDVVQAALDRHHLTHRQFAYHLGYSPSHWSTLFRGLRPLSPAVRRCLLTSKFLEGVNPDDLWTVESAS